MSSYTSPRMGLSGCGYVTGVFFPHHECYGGQSGTGGARVSAWYGVMSECVHDRPVYSWQGDCSSNSCYGYLFNDIACHLVALVQVAVYFGILGNHDWGSCINANSCS